MNTLSFKGEIPGLAGVFSKLPGFAALCLAALFSPPVLAQTVPDAGIPAQQTITVTTTADTGPGSLRSALMQANQSKQPYKIDFGANDGLFSTPQEIRLSASLPVITGEVEINGFIPGLLWKAYGVTISGSEKHRVFEVAPSGDLRVSGITIKEGWADTGAAILNQGRLVAEGITLISNKAEEAGGAIANRGGTVFLINSTAISNHAERGGAVANLAGDIRVTNVTMSENQAATGSAVFSLGQLTLANTILTGADEQCVNSGELTGDSGHNLFTSGSGCGEPIITADPTFQALDYYNGPTLTLPISGASPARNLGSNTAAVDATGARLTWDQRGNGDPRFAGGYVDIGAFEHQSQLATEFVVDTVEDTGLRGCTSSGASNCPLRAAVELSIAGRHMVPIRFHPETFAEPQVLNLSSIPLDNNNRQLVIDGVNTGGVTIVVPQAVPWKVSNGAKIVIDPSIAKDQL